MTSERAAEPREARERGKPSKTVSNALAVTPEPREDGWDELRAALLTALQNNSYRGEWASDDRHMVPMRWDTDDAVDRILADIAPFLAATTPPPERPGTETRCPLEGVHEHAFRGPHRFREWEPGT